MSIPVARFALPQNFIAGVICGCGLSLSLLYVSYRDYSTKDKEIQDKDVVHELGPPLSDARYGGLTFSGDKDTIYEQDTGPFPFSFNHEVTKVFDDMVSRSVPLYREVNDFLLYWIHHHYVEGTAIVDLGCSTGTAFDLICKSYIGLNKKLTMVGIDNSNAMIDKCREKLSWAVTDHAIRFVKDDISNFQLETLYFKSSFVIVNYTLQFIPVAKRERVLKNIYRWMIPGGVLFLSEKLDVENVEMKKMVTYIYEDFKQRRGYSRTEIERKKEALMNVLVPYTEASLALLLKRVGFTQVEVALKWNNFGTFVATKPWKEESLTMKQPPKLPLEPTIETKYLDSMFDYTAEYLISLFSLSENNLIKLFSLRQEMFASKRHQNVNSLKFFDRVAKRIYRSSKFIDQRLDSDFTKYEVINLDEESQLTSILPMEDIIDGFDFEEKNIHFEAGGVVNLCDNSDIDPNKLNSSKLYFDKLVSLLMPWKKGPFKICDIVIDAEWRSDLKWARLKPWLPKLKDKSICDIGCNNGYFMFRMIDNEADLPKVVVGIEPSLNCFLQFHFLKSLSRNIAKHRLKFEYAYGDMLSCMPKSFDIVFCLGVLYHTTDPIKMLRDIHASLKSGGFVFIDCQGISLDDDKTLPLALFPQKRYANMKGVYFTPNLACLKNWLSRSSFKDITVTFNEQLSTKEQRITRYAPVNSSLSESLNPHNASLTIENYPAPYRFYVRARKG